MKKSDKLIAIYKELRWAIGGQAPAGELLAIASMLIQQFDDYNRGLETSEGRATRSLPTVATDEAINSWSWRVLEYEIKLLAGPDDWSPTTTRHVRDRIKYLSEIR